MSFRVVALDDSKRLDAFYSRPGADMFRVFQAFDGRKGEMPRCFNRLRFESLFGISPSTVEMAIAASHYLLMREFAQECGSDSDVMVVAEDDALLSADFETVLQAVMEKVPAIGIINLAHPRAGIGAGHISGYSEQTVFLSMASTHLGKFDHGRYRCGHYGGALWGAGLYLVTRATARQYSEMVEQTGGIAWVADDWWRIATYAHVDVKFLRPNLAGWLGDSTFRETAPVVSRFAPRNLKERITHTVAVRSRLMVARNSMSVTLKDLADRLETKGRMN